MHNLNQKYAEKLISIIHIHLPEVVVYLYGSRARGDNRPGSDIDLALDAQTKI